MGGGPGRDMYGARRDGTAMDTSKVGGGIGCRCEVGTRCGMGEDARGQEYGEKERCKKGEARGCCGVAAAMMQEKIEIDRALVGAAEFRWWELREEGFSLSVCENNIIV